MRSIGRRTWHTHKQRKEGREEEEGNGGSKEEEVDRSIDRFGSGGYPNKALRRFLLQVERENLKKM